MNNASNGIRARRFLFAATVVSLCGCVVFSLRSPMLRNTAAGRRTTMLIVGTDGIPTAPHADTVILASYEPLHRILDVISIPRDTRIDEPGTRFRKLAEVYAFYVKAAGGDCLTAGRRLANTLGKIIGSSTPLVFDYVTVLSYESFRELLELVEPVTIFVAEPMHYDDAAGDLHIHFEPGTHRLNAARALEYVRFRDASGDLGRIGRQQQFLRAILSRIVHPVVMVRLPLIVWRFHRAVQSNLSLWDIFAIAVELRRLHRSSLWFSSLKGDPQGRYLVLGEGVRTVMARRLAGSMPDEPARCIVKVYNASGIPRMALRGTEYLRSHGYDVLDWTTWGKIIPHSRIIDRTGNPLVVRRLAALLNISDVHTQLTAEYAGDVVDVMVILGEDSAGNDVFRDGIP